MNLRDHHQDTDVTSIPGNWNYLVAEISLQIRQSLELQTILQTTTDEVQKLLQCDRVLLYRFDLDWSGKVVVETVVDPQWSVLGQVVHDPCFESCWLQPYQENQVRIIADVTTANLTPCHAEFLASFHVKANLVVPVLRTSQLWGLLICHNCTASRQWQTQEIEGLQQIAIHVGIAIHQACLLLELQQEKAKLEAVMATRTKQLEQTNLDFLIEVRERSKLEIIVSESERFLRQVLDSIFTFVGVLTFAGILIEVNQAPLDIAGITREGVIGKNFADTYWWEYSPEAQAKIRATIKQAQQGIAVRFDIPVQAKEGKQIIIDFSLYPLRNEQGEITHLIPSGTDITERKQAEIALQKSRDERFRLAAIVESSEAAIISKTLDGIITTWNQAAERLFGYNTSEIIGKHIKILIPLERQTEAAFILECIQQGEKVNTYETQRQHKDGSLIDVALTISPICDENGVIIGASKIARDIRDRKLLEAERNQVELELRQSKEQLEDFFDNASDLIQSVSLEDGKFIYVNRAWLERLGYRRDELNSLTVFDLIHPDCLHNCQQIFQALQLGGKNNVERLAISFINKDGQQILLEGSINVRFAAGKPIATRAIFRDVTVQRQIEATLQEQTKILQIFYDYSPLMLGVVETSENDILHTLHNSTTLEFFGVSREQLDNKWASEIGVKPETMQMWLDQYRQSQETETPVQFEYEHHTDIQTYYLSSIVKYIGIADSGRPQFSFMVRDISAIKQLEIEHQKIELIEQKNQQVKREIKLLENILDIVLAGYWDWDLKNNTEYLSPGLKKMLGYADHELPNSSETWQKLMFQEDLPSALTRFEQHIQSHGEIPFYNEVRYLHKDGSIVWVIFSGQVIEWDENGNAVRMIGCHINITDRKQAENNLRHINLVLENAVEGIARLDVTGRYVSVNRAYAETCGYEANELIGKEWQITVYAEDLPALESAYQTMLKTGKVHQEARGVRKDGNIFYKQLIMISDYDDKGKFIGHYCFMKDISDRKEFEIALLDSEHRYRNIIETTLEGVWILDAEGKTTFVNQRMADMLGYSCSAMIGTHLMDFINPEDRPQAQIYMHRRIQGIGEQHPFKFQRQDGSPLWTLVSTTPIFDHDHNFLGATGLITNITELVTVQNALQNSEMQLSGVLNSSLDGIMAFGSVRNDQGKIIDFEWLLSNPTAYQIVGRENLIGKRLLAELPGNKEEGLFDLYVKVVETGEPIQRQFYYNHDKIEYWFENIAVKLGDGFAVTFRNITANKKAEQALQILNKQLEERITDLDQRHEEMLILSEISDFLQACLTVQEACQILSNLVQPLFPDCSGGLFITSSSRNRVERLSSWGESLSSIVDFYPNECWSLRRGKIHICNAQKFGLRCQHIPKDVKITNTICIPMIAQGETLGMFHIMSNNPKALSETKEQIARALAEQVGLALANLNLRETLQHQSIRDPLTGLFNRRYLEEFLNQEIARSQRKQQPIGVIMLDVDHFKRFNDTYGHDAGDYVLQSVGGVLKENIRSSDIACRYGGEEMNLILPESSIEETAMRAEEIRQAIAQLSVSHNRKTLGSVTVSLGVAGFPQHGASSTALIQTADAALYRAKATGRNRVVVAP
ncbi:PAS domain S-box protein [Cronbergia sp. UHCC 0137]|uniref:PAS domain S-box protein n=1 Tax=Cronbergia sp. UHCC 0137 TaxID=3110239 RepID=UPI002B1FDA3B|nr:PAS domain S-box protein [Cronbergia sp. UHCC 0137]MEA5619633.1 PAS domain S-box protein [Cronbergia sp. UHCC 0137]